MSNDQARPHRYVQMFREELAEPRVRFANQKALENENRIWRTLISSFCEAEVAHQVRRAVCRLQKMKAAGVFDEWRCRTFWDEMCVEEATGPGEFKPYMEPDVDRMLGELASSIEPETLAILTHWLIPGFTEDNAYKPDVDVSLITDTVRDKVWQTALNRGERITEDPWD